MQILKLEIENILHYNKKKHWKIYKNTIYNENKSLPESKKISIKERNEYKQNNKK